MTVDDALIWYPVADAKEITPGNPKQIRIADLQIAVFKVDDRFYAMSDVCSHEYALLSEGYQENDTIECPLHQAQFHIPTGMPLSAPAEEGVPIYSVKLDGDDLYVGIPASSTASGQ